MTTNDLRKLERTLEEMGLHIDDIIKIIESEQIRNKENTT